MVVKVPVVRGVVTTAVLLASFPSGGVGPIGLTRHSGANRQTAPKPAWNLRYYTLRGAAIDFMLSSPNVFSRTIGGRAVITQNDTYRELADLARRFSVRFAKDEFGGSRFFAKDSAANDVPSDAFIGKPFFAGNAFNEAGFVPSVKSSDTDIKQILLARPDWRMAVNGLAPPDRYGNITFWRSADARSILPPPDEAEADTKLIKLMSFVTRGSFPFGFFIQAHTVEIGGCGEMMMSDYALPRYMNVRIAVVENNSGHAIRVSGFQGSANHASGLRTAPADDRSLGHGRQKLAMGGPVTIAAGERLVVPLRLSFSFEDYTYASPNSYLLDMIGKRTAAQVYRYLLNDVVLKKKGLEVLVNSEKEEESKKVLIQRSTLDKFATRPWRDPLIRTDFVYGPSFLLASVTVENVGRQARGKSQSLNYATADGFGSCPYVAIWDERRSLWVDKGRVLIGRVGPHAEREETYELDSIPSQLAILEKESEETHLKSLYLETRFADGSIRRIYPSESVSESGTVIREGEVRVFRFDRSLAQSAISVRLHLAGYYVRTPRIRVVEPRD